METFNTHYVNIEKKLGVSPENYATDTNNSQEIIEDIIRKYQTHPSALKVKEEIFPKLKLRY